MRLKIKTEDFNEMKAAIESVLAAKPGAYEAYIDAGLSDMRFNWDVLRASKYDVWALNQKYDNTLNDDHINSALKLILGNSGLSSKQAVKTTTSTT